MTRAPTTHEALIHLMVVTSAADRDMADDELARIGHVIRTWPVFIDFDVNQLIPVAQTCQRFLAESGLEGMLEWSKPSIPRHLCDTAYAAAVEVANVDLEMRLEELRLLERLREHLAIDGHLADAIERTTKARHRMLS
ncbi:Tellurite resistance protein TerB [Mesorhizobium sp. NBSH29]|uniref:tellurite resistance TerB family protein n=1 Tax=Mesorhizobium sp. NBSH29 TaxID=2654249 RepID=UPI0018968FB4|nr:tellurite resistance TerB family protein [Mesorhizobium sp. NBSH29]QPC88608.1 Tellurite resistance protein TerB [Mesorhizobium sp. NBSH29]